MTDTPIADQIPAPEPAAPAAGDPEIVAELDELAVFLGSHAQGWGGQLLALIAKSDPDRRNALRLGFPRYVRAYELWVAWPGRPPTAAELRQALNSNAGGFEAAGTVPAPMWRTAGHGVPVTLGQLWRDNERDYWAVIAQDSSGPVAILAEQQVQIMRLVDVAQAFGPIALAEVAEGPHPGPRGGDELLRTMEGFVHELGARLGIAPEHITIKSRCPAVTFPGGKRGGRLPCCLDEGHDGPHEPDQGR